jgi:hypothetical protein
MTVKISRNYYDRHCCTTQQCPTIFLYEYELEELLDELKASLIADQDDYIFAVTEDSGHVAMVLIEKTGQVHINEQAREKLQALWPAAYTSNMKMLIPVFARQLHQGDLPINGVKTVKRS